MTRRVAGAVARAAVILTIAAAPAYAQSGQTAQLPLRFDFLDPGARSLGMGSAFTAVADDATAAFTNPAGLTSIRRSEVSAELRFRSLDTPFLAGGRLSGTPTGQGIDTIAGPLYGTSTDSAARPYFLSYVQHTKHVSLAAYRHELVLQNNSFLSQGPFLLTDSLGSPIQSRFNGLTGSRDIKIDNYGGAAGIHVTSALSLGINVSIYRFSNTASFASLPVVFDTFFSTLNASAAGTNSTTVQSGHSTRVGANAGALLRLNSLLQLGVVWRQGASFDFQQVGTVPGQPTVQTNGQFRSPNLIGIGVRALATNELTVAVDFDRVGYGRLTQDFISAQVLPAYSSRVSIASGSEVHAGIEYTLTKLNLTPTVRAGLWFDPNHAVQYVSDGSDSAEDQVLKASFPVGSGHWHYCAGIGVPLSRSYEVNAGADLSSGQRYVSASIVARFGK
jgi:long-subunit fatty acid transport protein